MPVGAGAAAVAAEGAEDGGASWPTSGDVVAEAGVVTGLCVFLDAVAVPFGLAAGLAELTFLRQELRELELLRLWQYAAVPGFGLEVVAGTGSAVAGAAAGPVSSCAKDGAATANAAKAAMLAIKRRIFDISRAACGGGSGAASLISRKSYCICAVYVNFLIGYKNCEGGTLCRLS